jgi:hypothetical protein
MRENVLAQTEDLTLLSTDNMGYQGMDAYVLDESSPLFGLHLKEHPVNSTF